MCCFRFSRSGTVWLWSLKLKVNWVMLSPCSAELCKGTLQSMAPRRPCGTFKVSAFVEEIIIILRFICWYMLSGSCFFGEDHNFLFGWGAFECFETLSFLLVFSSGQEPSPTSKDERLQQKTIPNHPPMSWCISMQLVEHLWNSRNCCQNPCKTEKGFSCNCFSELSWQKWWFLEELSIPTACYPWKIWVVSFRSKAIGAKRSPIFDKRYSYVKRPSAQHIQIHCWLPTIWHWILGILPIKSSLFLFLVFLWR